MGNKRKSQVERLPKSERRHGLNKIVVLPSTLPLVDHQLAQLSIASPRRSVPLPRLDDDALARVLTLAGPSAMLSALSVCSQWRRVAKQLLADVVRLDMSRIYAGEAGRATPPGYTQLLRTLRQFPNLRILLWQRWLYNDVMEDAADFVCTNFTARMLEEVELNGVLISGAAIVQLLKNCPKMTSVWLRNHSSVSDKLLNEVASYCKQRRLRDATFNLQSVKITQSRCVSKTGVGVLLEHAGLSSLAVNNCPGVRNVLWKSKCDIAMSSLSFANCGNLTRVLTILEPGVKDVLDLNLSQCTSLLTIEFRSGGVVGTETPLCLETLNLSGCRSLHEIGLPSYEESWRSLENLQHLNLFGAYSLRPYSFSTVFGLSLSECALPNLQRLDLNGCAIDNLKLVGYKHLEYVDCSGCGQLETVEIRDCWNLQTVCLLGKKSPLRRVYMNLSANCIVRGMRAQWHWQSFDSNQTIQFQ